MAELRTLIPAIGIRQAARKLGVKEFTALSWARRYGWTELKEIKDAMKAIPKNAPVVLAPCQKDSVHSTHSPALNGAQALALSMQDDRVQGRASALRLTRRALNRLEKEDDDAFVMPEIAGVMNQHVKSAALAGGWNAGTPPQRLEIRMTQASGPGIGDSCAEGPVIDAEGTIVPQGEIEMGEG